MSWSQYINHDDEQIEMLTPFLYAKQTFSFYERIQQNFNKNEYFIMR